MARWTRGEAEIQQLIAAGHLELVSGAQADGSPLLEQAKRTVATADRLIPEDPYSVYVLA